MQIEHNWSNSITTLCVLLFYFLITEDFSDNYVLKICDLLQWPNPKIAYWTILSTCAVKSYQFTIAIFVFVLDLKWCHILCMPIVIQGFLHLFNQSKMLYLRSWHYIINRARHVLLSKLLIWLLAFYVIYNDYMLSFYPLN